MASNRLLLWLCCAVAPGALLQAIACSTSPGESADAGPQGTIQPVDASKRPDTGVGVDAAAPTPPRRPPVLPTCLGESVRLETSGEKAYVKVSMSPPDAGLPRDAASDAPFEAGPPASVGDFLLDFGSNGSTIDLAGFKTTSPPTPSFCAGDASAPGAICTFPHFDFFGPWGQVSLVTADHGTLFSAIRQSGLIGTDFLSSSPFTIDYENSRVFRGSKTTFCADAQLLAAGFVPIPTGGFYTSDTSKLRPLSEVVTTPDAGTKGFVVPNVPTVPITIGTKGASGGVSALAQLDTGYDDRVMRHSLNVNQALLEQLMAKDSSLLTRSPDDDLFLTTCVPGVSQKAEAYTLRAGTAVDFVAQSGEVGRRDLGAFVFVKEKVREAERCGGIDTWTVPAAQMGASFLVDAFAVVFDPLSSRVWLPK